MDRNSDAFYSEYDLYRLQQEAEQEQQIRYELEEYFFECANRELQEINSVEIPVGV